MEEKLYRKHIIETAMGLQAVDGLKCSPFFVSQAERYIEGEISLVELEKIIDEYYKANPRRTSVRAESNNA